MKGCTNPLILLESDPELHQATCPDFFENPRVGGSIPPQATTHPRRSPFIVMGFVVSGVPSWGRRRGRLVRLVRRTHRRWPGRPVASSGVCSSHGPTPASDPYQSEGPPQSCRTASPESSRLAPVKWSFVATGGRAGAANRERPVLCRLPAACMKRELRQKINGTPHLVPRAEAGARGVP
jgi:hypothetical protein